MSELSEHEPGDQVSFAIIAELAFIEGVFEYFFAIYLCVKEYDCHFNQRQAIGDRDVDRELMFMDLTKVLVISLLAQPHPYPAFVIFTGGKLQRDINSLRIFLIEW